MRRRRDRFATDYIQETVRLFQRLSAESSVDRETLAWARDVLTVYFSSVADDDPVIRRAKREFDESVPGDIRPVVEKRPFPRSAAQPASVSYGDFLNLCQRRRSIRWFVQSAVPRELVDQAMLCARLAPSACNRQPYRFFIADDRELVDTIGNIPGGMRGYVENVPMLAVLIGDLSAYQYSKDRHAIYIDGSLAAMSLMLSLETLGLSSCPINWPDDKRKEHRLREQVPMEGFERPIMLMAIGYPSDPDLLPFSQKKGLEKVRQYAN